MPLIQSAIKRMRQTAKRRARNINAKRDVKSAVKAFFAKPSAELLSAAQSEIDTAVKKNILKKNTAARRKATLAKTAKEAGVRLAGNAKKTVAKTAAKPAAEKKAPAKSTTVKKTVAKTAEKAPATKKPAAKKTSAKK
ncbi:MAG TPA: 30S ribosomal protein S20 [Candidatus Saccharimonadales bacterium]